MSVYHVLIENNIIALSSFCKVKNFIPKHTSVKAMLLQIESRVKVTSCNNVVYKILNFSLAELNLILNIVLFTIFMIIAFNLLKNISKIKTA